MVQLQNKTKAIVKGLYFNKILKYTENISKHARKTTFKKDKIEEHCIG